MSSQEQERPTTIRQDAPFTTVVQILEVDPDYQQTVVDALGQILIVSTTLPGSLSAQVLRSLDGMRVVCYEQWVSEDDWYAGLQHPVIQKQREYIRSCVIAGEPHFYDVCYVAHLHAQDETILLPGMGGIAINEVTTTSRRTFFLLPGLWLVLTLQVALSYKRQEVASHEAKNSAIMLTTLQKAAQSITSKGEGHASDKDELYNVSSMRSDLWIGGCHTGK